MRSGVFSGPDAALTPEEQLAIVRAAPEMAGRNLSAEVSVTEETVTPARGDRIGVLAILDLGVKQSTVDNLADRGFEVHVLPQSVTLEQLLAIDPVAVFYSNGPGDPEASDAHVALLRGVLDAGLPFFGICFGNQLLGRALGLGTYKLPFGHRGINQPVLDKSTGRVEVTSHNHGFAVTAPLAGRLRQPERLRAARGQPHRPQRRRGRGSATPSTSRPSRCSTTPRPRPVRTTPTTCSTGSPTW